jgi:hypothetical protein
MKDETGHPPQWADALLRSLLRPVDRESISGDLLEEYRAVRRRTLGLLGADVWCIRQVISVLWRLIWPAALVLAAQAVFLALTVFRPGHHAPHPIREAPPMWLSLTFQLFWYGSIVGAPGVSLFDGAVYFVAAYRGVQRTRLIRTGIIAGAASSLVGFVVLYASAAVVTPSLAMALLANPALSLIVSVHLLIVQAYAALVGTLAGTFSRWVAVPRRATAPTHCR